MEPRSHVPLSIFFCVQYYYDNGEHYVDFSMSGCSKNKEKSQQTKFSVRNNVKTLFHKGMKGKAIFESLVNSSYRFEETSTSADHPNSYNQIYDLRCKQKSKNTKDEIVELVDSCNVQKGLPNAFIRGVSKAPELAVVVTNDQQLQDILKFCAMDHCRSIFGVDSRGVARTQKKYLKISQKFLTLMTSHIMTSYRETNIAKKKDILEFHSNH